LGKVLFREQAKQVYLFATPQIGRNLAVSFFLAIFLGAFFIDS
jgi:hypothetical protein